MSHRSYTHPKPPQGYLPTAYYRYKYRLYPRELKRAREHGLRYLKVGERYYYLEKDIHDFYAGKYGEAYEEDIKENEPI